MKIPKMASIFDYVLIVLLLIVKIASCEDMAYELSMSCEIEESDTNLALKNERDLLMTVVNAEVSNKLKGYGGTVGIIGGSANTGGSIYFAAMTALRLGIDEVKIFCDEDTAEILRKFSSDITIYATLENSAMMQKTIEHLEMVDIIILGPGLEYTSENKNSVIPKVIKFCKTHKKPLIIDLEAWFFKTEFAKELITYPESGVILIPNQNEFERIHQLLKMPGNKNITSIKIDESKYGKNIYILRKGCIDRGISVNKNAIWTSLEEGGLKKTNGQGHMLSGAVAAYHFWALKHLEVTKVKSKGPMYHAGVSTFAASALIRKCSQITYEQMRFNMMTSDMVELVIRATQVLE